MTLARPASGTSMKSSNRSVPALPTPTMNPPPDCHRERCVGNHAVRGEVEVPAAKLGIARSVLSGWLQQAKPKVSACMAEHHHAISFAQGGREYAVLFCYTCGQYALWRDGELIGFGARWDPPGLIALNELLAEGGVAGHVPPSR